MKLNRSFYSFHSGVFFDFGNACDLTQLSTQGMGHIYVLASTILIMLQLLFEITLKNMYKY